MKCNAMPCAMPSRSFYVGAVKNTFFLPLRTGLYVPHQAHSKRLNFVKENVVGGVGDAVQQALTEQTTRHHRLPAAAQEQHLEYQTHHHHQHTRTKHQQHTTIN